MRPFYVNTNQNLMKNCFHSNGTQKYKIHYTISYVINIAISLYLNFPFLIVYLLNLYKHYFRYKFTGQDEIEFYRFTPPVSSYNDHYTSSQQRYPKQQYNNNRRSTSYKDRKKNAQSMHQTHIKTINYNGSIIT